MSGIYKIENPVGEIYIGQTKRTFEKRFDHYFVLDCKKQKGLYNSFIKHGIENHNFYSIHELDKYSLQEQFNYWEIYYYEYYKNCGFKMLNKIFPGSYSILTEKGRLKMSIIHKGNNNRLNKTHTIITKNKISKTKIEQNLSSWNKGLSLTDQQKENLREKNKGNKNAKGHIISEKTKQYLSNVNKIPICQYDLNGNFIKNWSCGKEVEMVLKIDAGNIAKCLRNKAKTSGGFIWKYSLN